MKWHFARDVSSRVIFYRSGCDLLEDGSPNVIFLLHLRISVLRIFLSRFQVLTTLLAGKKPFLCRNYMGGNFFIEKFGKDYLYVKKFVLF